MSGFIRFFEGAMGYTDPQGGTGMKILTVPLLIILAASLLCAQGGTVKQDGNRVFLLIREY